MPDRQPSPEMVAAARERAAQCWCATETSMIEMDHRLAEIVAREMAAFAQQMVEQAGAVTARIAVADAKESEAAASREAALEARLAEAELNAASAMRRGDVLLRRNGELDTRAESAERLLVWTREALDNLVRDAQVEASTWDGDGLDNANTIPIEKWVCWKSLKAGEAILTDAAAAGAAAEARIAKKAFDEGQAVGAIEEGARLLETIEKQIANARGLAATVRQHAELEVVITPMEHIRNWLTNHRIKVAAALRAGPLT